MRILVSTLFVASSIVVGLAAQAERPAAPPTPGAPQTQQPAAPSGEPARAAKVVIGGCIQNAPAASAASGAAAQAPAAKFVLANAKQISSPAAGSESAGTSGAAATRYRLDGEEKLVATHVNHQVEITGMVQTLSSPGAPGAGAGPVLRVDSVKMIADKCS